MFWAGIFESESLAFDIDDTESYLALGNGSGRMIDAIGELYHGGVRPFVDYLAASLTMVRT